MTEQPNRRILVIDDTKAIHDDIKKLLQKRSSKTAGLEAAKAAFFNEEPAPQDSTAPSFEIDSAFQGEEGFELLRRAREEGRPYAVAFVDVRMPPGWDGVQTIERLWEHDDELQTVICTAYSDYSWDQTVAKLGSSDRLMILKKPFDSVEICQLATALSEKWNVKRSEQKLLHELRRAEEEARSYAASLETVNSALVTAKAASDKSAHLRTDFLVRLSDEIHGFSKRIFEDDALRDASLSVQELKRLDRVLDANRAIVNVFDRVLEFALLEDRRLPPEVTSCSPGRIVADVLAEKLELARDRNVQLHEQCHQLPERVRTDGSRLRRILDELVTNAIEHTTGGSVWLEARVKPTQDWRRPQLHFRVLDEGPGLGHDDRERVFEPFGGVRARQATEKERGGLGLALCRLLAQSLGGQLVLESTSESGSAFGFTVATEVS